MGMREFYNSIFRKENYAKSQALQLLFEQASLANIPLERIPESKKNFLKNAQQFRLFPIAHGDFTSPLFSNVEIEVKCKKIYAEVDIGDVFYLADNEWKALVNLQCTLKLDDVVFAFYECQDAEPINDSLRMSTLNFIQQSRYRRLFYCENRNLMRIPLRLMFPGLTVLQSDFVKDAALQWSFDEVCAL